MRLNPIQLVAMLVCLIGVVSASFVTPSINAARAELDRQMIGVANPQASAPPEYVFWIQAFGAFRGLITNIAFIRAEQYKMEGRYYDAHQLATWICQLQPRFPSVWEFQSWNMAWNISITAYTPEERWNWVYNGVKLIRDQGLKYNPRAVNLYRQIAWIFVNKMSENTDEFHLFFKRNWAWKMHLVLGPPPDQIGDYRPGEQVELTAPAIGRDPLAEAARKAKEQREEIKRLQAEGDPNKPAPPVTSAPAEAARTGGEDPLGTRAITIKAYQDHLQAIADMPEKLEGLYEKYPRTREMVLQLRQLGVPISDDTLSEESYGTPEGRHGLAFEFFYRYRTLADQSSILSQVVAKQREDLDTPKREKFDEIVGVTQSDPDGNALLRFLQKKTLKEVYKLDAGRMAELTGIFGPIDWRVVDAHSLYWVNEGLIAGEETISRFGNDKTNTARLIFFSLRNLLHRNKLRFEPYTENVNYAYVDFGPDLNFVESMHQAYLTYGKMLDPSPEEKGVGATYRSGHINFLEEAIRLLYFANRKEEAQAYLDYLRENYSMQDDGTLKPLYANTLENFVSESFRDIEVWDTWREAFSTVQALIGSAYGSLADDNYPEYERSMRFAREIHSRYMQERKHNPSDKMSLPSFRDMTLDAVRDWFRQPPTSPFVTIRKARLWAMMEATPSLKQALYDELLPLFKKETEIVAFDLDRTFPEPEGMEQWRAEHPDRSKKAPEDGVETPTQRRE